MEIIYVFDVLCGWCFGFSPVMQEMYKRHADMKFTVISGGLVTGSRVGPMSNMAGYIEKAIPGLEKTTGVIVGEEFKKQLKIGARIQNSLTPAIALCILKEMLPDNQVPLAHAIQQAYFVKGEDLENEDTYAAIAKSFDLDEVEFKRKMADPRYENMANEEFEQAKKWGITGFPAVILNRGDSLIAISNGYTTFADLEKRLESAITMEVNNK
jgi:putative protein-disulfide isomerase